MNTDYSQHLAQARLLRLWISASRQPGNNTAVALCDISKHGSRIFALRVSGATQALPVKSCFSFDAPDVGYCQHIREVLSPEMSPVLF